ncbi:MAG: type 4a pilus biogenesis protein PilO [Planctomycetes bacterium]|nr:type 4a pilus biogenesis protein PilO [Planctomycetota bacterium]
MSKLSQKQLLLTTILVPTLLVGGIGYMAWLDYQKIYAAEITPEHPESAEIVDPELWGERRRCQEIQKEMEGHRAQADLIGKREQDVIVYREIVQRDAQILPDKDQVNKLADTINEFERASGVTVTSVADLNLTGDPAQAIRRLPIRLALTGSFDQFLKFLNLFETMDRIVNTRSFGIAAGGRQSDDPNSPAMHGISLELETYVYNPGAGLAKPVEIPNYERRKDDPAIQKLVRQQKAARVERYQLKPRINRRDPLVDPRRSQAGPEDGGVTQEKYEELKKLVDSLKVEIETLKEDVRLEKQYMDEKKYLQYVQLKTMNDEKVQRIEISVKDADPRITVQELREVFQDEVVGPFTKIASDRTKSAERTVLVVLASHVKEFLNRQAKAIEEHQYERAAQVQKEFDTFMAQGNRKLAEDAAPFVAELKETGRQAGVMLEFLAMNLKVSGLIRKADGSIVILNNRSRKVGDVIDDAGRCKLTAIKDTTLVFEFDGYEIEHELDNNKK